MNYMNIVNNNDNHSKLRLTSESETTTITQTISLLTRKVNELNTELNNKVKVLEQNMKDISDTIMTKIEYHKINTLQSTPDHNEPNQSDNNNGGNVINVDEKPVTKKVTYATEEDLNVIGIEIAKVKSYTLDIYNEVIKMRNIVDSCQAYKDIKRDICNLNNDIIGNANNNNNNNNWRYYDRGEYLYNSDEWIHTHSILEYLNI